MSLRVLNWRTKQRRKVLKCDGGERMVLGLRGDPHQQLGDARSDDGHDPEESGAFPRTVA